MQKASIKFLQNLLSVPSPSGYEGPAQNVWTKYVSPFCDKIEKDSHGNRIAVRNQGQSMRVMFAAHMDELGFIVKHIDDQGYIFFQTIGGHDLSVIPGRRVIIQTKDGPVRGATGKKAIHIMTPEERKKVSPIEDLWIDIGLENKELVMDKVRIGDPVVYDTEMQFLNDDILVSRAFDDKIGVFALAEALRLLQNQSLGTTLYMVSTVQEEIGMRGAVTSAYHIDPSVGIAVDVTQATDYPKVDKRKYGDIKLGKGPVILKGANANSLLTEIIIESAEAESIPYQIEAEAGSTGTDAASIQLTRKGVATGLISIPLRYMHTPSEVVSLKDVENTARLLASVARLLSHEHEFFV